MILVSIILTNCPPPGLWTCWTGWSSSNQATLMSCCRAWTPLHACASLRVSRNRWQICFIGLTRLQRLVHSLQRKGVCCVCVHRLAIKHLCSMFHLPGSFISSMMFSYFHHFSQPHLRLPVRAVCEWWWTLSRPITSVPSATLSSVNSCRNTTTPHQQSTTPSSAIWRCVYVHMYKWVCFVDISGWVNWIDRIAQRQMDHIMMQLTNPDWQ